MLIRTIFSYVTSTFSLLKDQEPDYGDSKVMGQFSVHSPLHLTQKILPELTCNLTTLKVSHMRGVRTTYIRHISPKLRSSKFLL